MTDLVTIEKSGGIADVRLNRPDKYNALNSDMFKAIIEAGESLAEARDVRVIVLSGNGRGFCAGLDMGSFQDRDRIGNILAPKDVWGEWGPSLTAGTGRDHGGMISLTMEQRLVDDRPKGHIRAKIEPSSRIKDGETGIFMEINDHFEIYDAEQVIGCEEIVNILEHNFDTSIKRSEWIADQIMKLK